MRSSRDFRHAHPVSCNQPISIRHMNIALVSYSDLKGGAALAAKRLSAGLSRAGHDARMLVRVTESADQRVVRIERGSILNAALLLYFAGIQRAINRSRTRLTNTFFSIPYPGF